MKKINLQSVLIIAVMLACLPGASASMIFFNELPANNVNAAANRSNIDVGVDPAGNTPCCFFFGDSVLFGATGIPTLPQWRIDKLVVWSTGRTGLAIGDEYSRVTLYGSAYGQGLQTLASGTYAAGSNTPNNGASISSVPDTYPGGASYIGSAGDVRPLWKTTFDNLNFITNPNTGFQFGIYAAPQTGVVPTGADPLLGQWRILTSNTLGGNPAATDGGAGVGYFYFNTGFLPDGGALYPGSTTDMNFELFASPVPEPASLGLVGLGLIAGFAAYRRKK